MRHVISNSDRFREESALGPNQENEILRNNEKIDGRVMPKFLCGTLLEDLPWDGLRKFGKLSVSTLSNNDLSWGSYWSPKLDDSTDKTKILIVDDDLEARFEILYLLLEDSTLRLSLIHI